MTERMSAAELRSLMRRADRKAAWLGRQTGVSHVTVGRWQRSGVPADRAERVRGLLQPLPPDERTAK